MCRESESYKPIMTQITYGKKANQVEVLKRWEQRILDRYPVLTWSANPTTRTNCFQRALERHGSSYSYFIPHIEVSRPLLLM